MRLRTRRLIVAGLLAGACAAGCGGALSDPLDVQTILEQEAQQVALCESSLGVVSRVSAAVPASLAPGSLELATSTPHPAVDARPSDAEWWEAEYQRLNAEVQQHQDAGLVFIGDSITWGWHLFGNPVWTRYYSERRPLNLGIIGDQTQHVLWRLRHGNLAGLDPRTVVLLIGVNNAFDPTHEPRHIAAGVAAILDELKRQLPRTRVLLLGILPAGTDPSWFRDKLAVTNALLGELASDRVSFLDIGQQLLDRDGRLAPEIAFDQLHLTERGYEIWAREVEPTLRNLLGERSRASVDSRTLGTE